MKKHSRMITLCQVNNHEIAKPLVVSRLLQFRFEWVLPGHGRRHHAPAEEMRDSLARCVAGMRNGARS